MKVVDWVIALDWTNSTELLYGVSECFLLSYFLVLYEYAAVGKCELRRNNRRRNVHYVVMFDSGSP